jgi:hypothetical protein
MKRRAHDRGAAVQRGMRRLGVCDSLLRIPVAQGFLYLFLLSTPTCKCANQLPIRAYSLLNYVHYKAGLHFTYSEVHANSGRFYQGLRRTEFTNCDQSKRAVSVQICPGCPSSTILIIVIVNHDLR